MQGCAVDGLQAHVRHAASRDVEACGKGDYLVSRQPQGFTIDKPVQTIRNSLSWIWVDLHQIHVLCRH